MCHLTILQSWVTAGCCFQIKKRQYISKFILIKVFEILLMILLSQSKRYSLKIVTALFVAFCVFSESLLNRWIVLHSTKQSVIGLQLPFCLFTNGCRVCACVEWSSPGTQILMTYRRRKSMLNDRSHKAQVIILLLPSLSQSAWNTQFYFGHQKKPYMDNNIY